MSFIEATNVVANQLQKRRPTETPTARAKNIEDPKIGSKKFDQNRVSNRFRFKKEGIN